tara:strand:- start:776 stop:1132 length:357 start_codon:yes stop_codon:yes gene_type:complete
MKNVNWGNSIVKAVFDLEILPCGIVIKDCMLKHGKYGFFVSSPNKKLKEPFKGQNGEMREYLDIVWIPKQVRDMLNKIAGDTYDEVGDYPEFQKAPEQKAPVSDNSTTTWDDIDGVPS